MRTVVVTPPEPVVSVEEAKLHLRVDGDDEDTVIAGMIAAATGFIDGPDGWLGRAIGVQELEYRGDLFRCDPIRLPYPPVVDIISVEYEDGAGVVQTLDPSLFELRGAELGTAWGKSWPSVRAYRGPAETVRVRYNAGYADLPPAIRVAILMMVGDMYRHRSETVDGSSAAAAMSFTVANLLAPFRVFS